MPEAVESPIRSSSVNMGNILKPLLCASAGKEVTDSSAPLCAIFVLVIFPPFLTHYRVTMVLRDYVWLILLLKFHNLYQLLTVLSHFCPLYCCPSRIGQMVVVNKT